MYLMKHSNNRKHVFANVSPSLKRCLLGGVSLYKIHIFLVVSSRMCRLHREQPYALQLSLMHTDNRPGGLSSPVASMISEGMLAHQNTGQVSSQYILEEHRLQTQGGDIFSIWFICIWKSSLLQKVASTVTGDHDHPVVFWVILVPLPPAHNFINNPDTVGIESLQLDKCIYSDLMWHSGVLPIMQPACVCSSRATSQQMSYQKQGFYFLMDYRGLYFVTCVQLTTYEEFICNNRTPFLYIFKQCGFYRLLQLRLSW